MGRTQAISCDPRAVLPRAVLSPALRLRAIPPCAGLSVAVVAGAVLLASGPARADLLPSSGPPPAVAAALEACVGRVDGDPCELPPPASRPGICTGFRLEPHRHLLQCLAPEEREALVAAGHHEPVAATPEARGCAAKSGSELVDPLPFGLTAAALVALIVRWAGSRPGPDRPVNEIARPAR